MHAADETSKDHVDGRGKEGGRDEDEDRLENIWDKLIGMLEAVGTDGKSDNLDCNDSFASAIPEAIL